MRSGKTKLAATLLSAVGVEHLGRNLGLVLSQRSNRGNLPCQKLVCKGFACIEVVSCYIVPASQMLSELAYDAASLSWFGRCSNLPAVYLRVEAVVTLRIAHAPQLDTVSIPFVLRANEQHFSLLVPGGSLSTPVAPALTFM